MGAQVGTSGVHGTFSRRRLESSELPGTQHICWREVTSQTGRGNTVGRFFCLFATKQMRLKCGGAMTSEAKDQLIRWWGLSLTAWWHHKCTENECGFLWIVGFGSLQVVWLCGAGGVLSKYEYKLFKYLIWLQNKLTKCFKNQEVLSLIHKTKHILRQPLRRNSCSVTLNPLFDGKSCNIQGLCCIFTSQILHENRQGSLCTYNHHKMYPL